jgi:hypothetical protein
MASHNGITQYSYSLPKICPRCNRPVELGQDEVLGETLGHDLGFNEAAFKCPHDDCGRFFIGFYDLVFHEKTGICEGILQRVSPIDPIIDIPGSVKILSPEFCNIYSECLVAKASGLLKVAGIGLRKALEFLFKDYAKSKVEASQYASVENSNLSDVISNHIPNSEIKIIAERAIWIGNDEAHYIRRWKNKDLEDLLSLTSLIVQWIHMDCTAKGLLQEMPKMKKE